MGYRQLSEDIACLLEPAQEVKVVPLQPVTFTKERLDVPDVEMG
jgi:hypothetical protein